MRALVEEGSFAIDSYQANTIDKAVYRDHTYSDKAPGGTLALAGASLPFATGLAVVAVDPQAYWDRGGSSRSP